jgi:hypothetical protein
MHEKLGNPLEGLVRGGDEWHRPAPLRDGGDEMGKKDIII